MVEIDEAPGASIGVLAHPLVCLLDDCETAVTTGTIAAPTNRMAIRMIAEHLASNQDAALAPIADVLKLFEEGVEAHPLGDEERERIQAALPVLRPLYARANADWSAARSVSCM